MEQGSSSIAMSTHAVIMGDLIKSQRTDSVARLHGFFNDKVEAINRHYRRAIVSPLTITLGDEFQGLTHTLASALEMAKTMRMALMADDVPCRFVIGLVHIATPVNRRTSWNMMGPGLADARQKLNVKDDDNAIRFSVSGDPVTETLLDAIGASITNLQNGWTPRQAEVAQKLKDADASPSDLIKQMKIAANTYYKIRRAARIELHDRLWNALSMAVADIDQREGLRGR